MQYNKNRNDLKLRHYWPLYVGGGATGGVEVDGVVYFKGTLYVKLDGSEEWTKITSSPYSLSSQSGTTWKVGENGEEHYYLSGLKTYQYLVFDSTKQYINSQVTPDEDNIVNFKSTFALLNNSSNRVIIGWNVTGNTYVGYFSTTDKIGFPLGAIPYTINKPEELTVHYDYLNSSLYTSYGGVTQTGVFTGTPTRLIIGYNTYSIYGLYGTTQFFVNEELTKSYVPCLCQNEYGFYDFTNKVFTPASGATPFTTVLDFVGTTAYVNSESINIDFLTGSDATTLHLDRPIVTTLGNSSYIPDTITRIEVPAAVYSQYITATNWATLANKIYAY